ncbi:MAG TPA: TetR/AcrR family transcriptional regulator [Tepidisphaeraceae bacterium]|jgi:AcrR family transcriptional regulator
MARPSQLAQKRKELIPVVAHAFAEAGYRRMTTAELARRCGLRENVLYRLWPDKKAMFMAAIDYVYELSAATWRELIADAPDPKTSTSRLLAYEAGHHGDFGLYRIVFAGLSETDDPDIRAALARMYEQFQQFIRELVEAHRDKDARSPEPNLAAWALIGLGTVSNITHALRLLNDAGRTKLMQQAGQCLLGGSRPGRHK